MSEKTLMALVETRQEVWIAMLDARIRRAEAAEQVAEAFGAVIDSVDGHSPDDGKLNEAWQEYVAAREAVRKLEETT